MEGGRAIVRTDARYVPIPVAQRERPMDHVENMTMRKQYHLRPGKRGLDAWDVDRLIALAAGLPVQQVRLADIADIDTPYWFGAPERATVRKVVDHLRLVQEVDPFWPILLDPDGHVMDGMHRVARALLDGRATIAAVRLSALPEPDYRNCRPEDLPYWRAAGYQPTRGRRLR